MAQAILIADRTEAVIQPGQPPAQMAAYLLDYDPATGSALQAAADFATTAGFPIGTVARVVDLHALDIPTFQLQSSWAPVPDEEPAP